MATLPLRTRVDRLLGAQPNSMGPVWRATNAALARAVPFLTAVGSFGSYRSGNPRLEGLCRLAAGGATSGKPRQIRIALNELGDFHRHVPDASLRDGLTQFLGDFPGFGHAMAELTSLLMVQVSDSTPPVVSFGPLTDGPPGIVQGGLVAYAGMMALDANSGGLGLVQGPFRLTVVMNRPMAPKGQYSVSYGDYPVGSSAYTAFYAPSDPSKSKPPAIFSLRTLSSGEIDGGRRVGLTADLLRPAFGGHCLPTCAAGGSDNPLGLDQSRQVFVGSDGRILRVVSQLNHTTGTGLRPQLMEVDDVAWALGVGFIGQLGFTTAIDYWHFRQPEAEQSLHVIAEQPTDVTPAGKPPRMEAAVSVVNAVNGDVMSRGVVTYVAAEARVSAALHGRHLGSAAEFIDRLLSLPR